MKAQEIILEPILTEKSYAGIPNKVYTFKVATSANKIEIKNESTNFFIGLFINGYILKWCFYGFSKRYC